MAKAELVLRSHVEHGDEPVLEPRKQILSRYRLQFVAGAEVARQDLLNFRSIALAYTPERSQEENNFLIASQAVEHPFAVASGLRQPRTPQYLEVTRGVGEGQAGSSREILDAPLALSQVFQQFQAVGVAERLCNLGQARENSLLGGLDLTCRSFHAIIHRIN